MTYFKDIQRLYYFTALALGLITAQIIATLQVYASNTELFANLTHIQNAGYLAIPNRHIMTGLQSFKTAFLGGLFFTFSIGAGLGLIALAAAWLWNRPAHRKKNILIVLIILWSGLLIGVNINGGNGFVTLYVLCIPLIVFITTIRLMPPTTRQSALRNQIIHWVPILVLAFLWATQADRDVFVDLRDSLLLSNPLGMTLSNFYYRNSLYPAEAFKSLDQKMLKTCTLQIKGGERVRRRLEIKLLANDYLPIPAGSDADLKIIQTGNRLYINHDNKTILEVPVDDFLLQSATVLSTFSRSIDRNTIFRMLTFQSLIYGFPVAFFIVTHSLFTGFFLLLMASRKAALCATILFFLIGLGLLVPLHVHRSSQLTQNDLDKALNSENRQERIAALKMICQLAMDISRFAAYPKLLENPNPAERYWIVRALGSSRSSDTYNDLLSFLDDPQLNVRTMAFYALGQQKRSHAKKIIIDRIKNSRNWYDQWYAYKALRTLGWKQTKSQ